MTTKVTAADSVETVEYQEEYEGDFDLLTYFSYYITIANTAAALEVMRQLDPLKNVTYNANGNNAIMSDRDYTLGCSTMASIAKQTMVALRKDGGCRVQLPVIRDFRIFNSCSLRSTSAYVSSTWLPGVLSSPAEVMKVFKFVETKFGTDFWDIDKAVSWSFDVNDKSLDHPDISIEQIDEEVDFIKHMLSRVNRIHLIGTTAQGNQVNRKIRKLEDINPNDFPDKDAYNTEVNSFKANVVQMRSFMVYVEIDFSAGMTKYITQSEKPKLAHLHQYFTVASKNSAQDFDVPYVFNPVSNIKVRNKGRRKAAAKMNEFGLALDRTGVPIYIPTLDNVDGYDKLYETMGKGVDGFGWSISSPFSKWVAAADAADTAVDNKIIYYDPVNSMLSYSSEGSVQVKNLNTCIPAKDTHIWSLLNTSVETSNTVMQVLKSYDYYVKRFPAALDAAKASINLDDFAPCFDEDAGRSVYTFNDYWWAGDKTDASFVRSIGQLLDEGVSSYYEEVTRALQMLNQYYARKADLDDNFEMPKDQKWAEDYSVNNIKLLHLTSKSAIRILRPLGVFMEKVSDLLVSDPIKNIEGRAVAQGMVAVGLATIYSKYVPRIDEVQKNAEEYARKLKPISKPDPNWKPFAIPGAMEGFMFLPHQGKVHQYLQDNPELGILPVSAGGGKTTIALTYIMKAVAENRSKRPLVICPVYLISNYIEDLIMICGGKWNIVPITASTVKAHGQDKLAALVQQAPPNTIFVTDYLYIKGGSYELPYGTDTIMQSANSEFLRDLGFDIAFVDESHIIKNEDSQTTQATTSLLYNIPVRYLMSGTLVSSNLQDLVPQVRVCDPTVFGSMKDFVAEYAESAVGDKITAYRADAPKEISTRIENRVAYVQANKREWAALLPKRVEKFHEAVMTKNQRTIYQTILEGVLEELQQNKDLMDKLKKVQDQDDEEYSLAMESMLNPYLQKLEIFLTAPTVNEAGDKALVGDDRISPKVLKAIEICEDHLRKKIPGKILIFTSYTASAEAIYDSLPPALKKKALLYRASQKSEHKAIFKNDPNIQIMIGVENSLNTGHNFQYVSRIIRMESVWSPGNLEQAESRIFRPDVKNRYGINEKYLDWVICSSTIDVTKCARLISKIMVKTKFDEKDNPLYDNLPMPDLIPMTLDSIQSSNDFEADLRDHLEAYKEFSEKREIDYEQYKKNPDTLKTPFKVPTTAMMPGSGFLIQAPYIENMVLPFEDKLGLESLAAYAAERKQGVDTFDATGLIVHTEWGEGKVVRSSSSTIHVMIGDKRFITEKTKAFVFIDQKVGAKHLKEKGSIRSILAKMIGNPVQVIDPNKVRKPIIDKPVLQNDAPKSSDDRERKRQQKLAEKKLDKPHKPVPNTDFDENNQFSLFAIAINNQIGVAADVEDPDVPNADEMKKLGFALWPEYAYAPITNRNRMRSLVEFINAMEKKGTFKLTPNMRAQLDYVADAFEKSKNKAMFLQKLDVSQLRDYRFTRLKTPTDPNIVHLYFAVEDDEIYALVDMSKAKAGRRFIKKKVKGINWTIDEGMWVATFRSKKEAKVFAKDFAKKYPVANLDEFMPELNDLVVTTTGPKAQI